MQLVHLLFTFALLVAPAFAAPEYLKGKPTKISSKTFADLQYYAKFAITAYRDNYECNRPLNTTVVSRVSQNPLTAVPHGTNATCHSSSSATVLRKHT